MTSQGSPSTRLRRALDTRNPNIIVPAALECERVALTDALAICLVFAAREPNRYPTAAARWLGRYAVEERCGLSELGLLYAALTALREPEQAQAGLDALHAIFGEERRPRLAAVVEWWLDGG